MVNSIPRPNTVILAIDQQRIKYTHYVKMSTAREIYEDTLSSRYARVAYSADNDDICMYVCESILRSCTSQVSISGLVVKFLLAMQEPWVRFPADAILCLEAQTGLILLHSEMKDT